MGNSRYEAVISFLIQFDRDILLYILPVDFFFSMAVVAVLARGRRPLELLSIFFISYFVLFFLAASIFHFGLDRPFALFQLYTFPQPGAR